jgi:REP-associated tyrosine transposase
MPSTFTQNFYHAVFSTKHRAPLIAPDLEVRLYPFIGGILRDLRCTLIAVNGMPDHIHLLIRYRADLSHSEMLQHIKGRSSKWVNESLGLGDYFSWQEGYGGFTVSKSMVPNIEGYFARQKDHHKHQSFQDEFLELLRRHEIEFDLDDVFQ